VGDDEGQSVSSATSGAVILKLSPFKNVPVPPVSVIVPLKVTVRPGCVVNKGDASENEIGVAWAAFAVSTRQSVNNVSLNFMIASTFRANGPEVLADCFQSGRQLFKKPEPEASLAPASRTVRRGN